MKNRGTLLIVILVLALLQGAFQRGLIFDKWQRDYSPKQKAMLTGLDPGQLLFAIVGLREFIAGILWVRADSFFDEGNYDAVLPIIRLVTWLDPHQIDVYATGMWHIGYNFTDTEQRSDRRYIPVALAFGAEGAKNNPDTYEMYFETGWMWFHKIDDDYSNAVGWWEKAVSKKDMQPARKNLLAKGYERNGELEKMKDLYYRLDADAQQAVRDQPDTYGNRQNVDTIEANIDNTLVRMSQRGWFAQQRGDFAGGSYDTQPPYDVGFSVRATVEDAGVLRFEGTWNVLPVGTRIRVVLKDKELTRMVDGKLRNVDEPGGMVWNQSDTVDFDTPRGMTFMQDGLFVRNRRFNRRVDMSNDRTMYPFKGDKYVLEFFYDPRSAPPHMQDKFGWNGEGMTDPLFLNTKVRPGHRVIFAQLELTRDQVLRQGQWTYQVPVVQTSNYKDMKTKPAKGDILLPTAPLRADTKPAAQKQ